VTFSTTRMVDGDSVYKALFCDNDYQLSQSAVKTLCNWHFCQVQSHV